METRTRARWEKTTQEDGGEREVEGKKRVAPVKCHVIGAQQTIQQFGDGPGHGGGRPQQEGDKPGEVGADGETKAGAQRLRDDLSEEEDGGDRDDDGQLCRHQAVQEDGQGLQHAGVAQQERHLGEKTEK